MKCKFADKKAEQLHELKFEELRSCNCERCAPIADVKELEQLRAFKQEQDLKAAAIEEGKRLAKEIIETGKAVNDELKDMVQQVVQEELKSAGFDFSTPIQRLVEKKMQFDVSNAPRINSRHGRDQLSPEMKSFIHWAKTGEVIDRKALAGGTANAGGYLVPEEFRSEVIRKLAALTVVRRSGARAFPVSSDSISIPVVSANGSGAWTGENQQYQESDPTFGNVNLTPHKYTRLVRASVELLEDSAINVADLLADIFAEDFAAAEDAAFVAGDGVNKPTGIAQAAIGTVAAANTSDQNQADSLVKTVYALPRQYRNGAVWYINSKAIQRIRLLKDANGRYIWQDGLQEGEPARLLGYPVFETDALAEYDLDGAGAGTDMGSNIIFGNPRYYYIADRTGMRLERSADRYFEFGQVAFRSDMRVDGKVALADAFKKLTGFKH
ncbi:phage major capsid protein [Effusibacillus pohliae]|uniref:phage major capsid protein n=1 Tax=Effusibacillus pohliae TaxID=232270 RepID=UPI0003760164|nr:phage major capsid protein [Effusibacillus pohliae]